MPVAPKGQFRRDYVAVMQVINRLDGPERKLIEAAVRTIFSLRSDYQDIAEARMTIATIAQKHAAMAQVQEISEL